VRKTFFHRVVQYLSLLMALLAPWVPMHAGSVTVKVTVSPSAPTVVVNQSQLFTATVTGTSKTAVTWSCSPSGATIDPIYGYFTASALGTYTVKATLNSDTTKIDTTTVTVIRDVKITISPDSHTVYGNTQIYFQASVTGAVNNNSGVSWGISGGTNTGSTIWSMNYTAPSVPGTYTVMATSIEDPSRSASVFVTVIPDNVVVTVSPTSVSLPVNGTTSISASVSGSNNLAYTWSASVGNIQSTVSYGTTYYTYVAPSVPGTYLVTATSSVDPTRSASIQVTVVPQQVAISISGPTSMAPGAKATFAISFTGTADYRAAWSAAAGTLASTQTNGNGKTMDYFAPWKAGTYTVVATSLADTTKSATASFTVVLATTPTIYGIDLQNRVMLPGTSALVVPYFTAAGATASLSPTVGTVTSGTGYPVTPATLTQYLLTLKVNNQTSYTAPSDWIAPGYQTSIAEDTALENATAFSQRTTGQSVVIRPDGKITVGGGGSITPDTIYLNGIGGHQDSGTFPVPDERVFDPVLGTAISSSGFSRAFQTPLLLANGQIQYFGGAMRDGVVYDSTVATYGGEVSLFQGFRDRYTNAMTLQALDGRSVLIGGEIAYTEYGNADHSEYYITERTDNSDWVEIQDPATGSITMLNMQYKRSGGTAVLLKDGRVFVAGGGARNYEQPEILNLVTKTSALANGLKSFWDSRNSVALSSVLGARLMFDGKVLILENVVATGARWVGIWDPVADAYTRKLQIPGWTGTAFLGDPIGDGLYPLGSIPGITNPLQGQWAEVHILFYDSVKNTVTATQDLGTPSPTRWFGMTAQGNVLLETVGPSTQGADGSYIPSLRLWRVGLGLPVTSFPSVASVPLGKSFRFSASSAKNETITWSVLEGSAGGSVASDGTYQAPVTAGIYHVVATTPSGRVVSTVKVLPSAPIVNSLTLDKTSGTAGTQVNVQWQVQWADTIHLQTFDNSGVLLTDQDVTGLPSASVTVSGNTSRFQVVATNISGSAEQSAYFTQWSVSYVSITPSGTLYLLPGATRALQASVQGSGDLPQTVTWTCTGGNITAAGLYTAPAVTGAYIVTATSTFDPTKSSTVTMQVGLAPTLASFSASPQVIASGQYSTLNWTAQNCTGFLLTDMDPFGNVSLYVNLSSGANSYVVRPTKTTTYTLSTSNGFGADSRQVTVTVSPVTALSITPTTATLSVGSTANFGSSITSTGSTGVTWSCSGGSIAGNGLAATYTAPTTPGNFTVTVTAVADPTRSATSNVTVVLPTVTLAISPASTTLTCGQTMTFGYNITSTDQNLKVSWSVVEGAAGGSITSAGLYTAPMTPGTYHATVTSVANPAVSASATVVVSYPSETLVINPTNVTLQQGGTFNFGFTSSNGGVSWTATGGSISQSGSYTAPLNIGNYSITITSLANPTIAASAMVTVVYADSPKITITPPIASVFPSGAVAFSATVVGLANPGVTWSLQGSPGSSVDQSGKFTASTVPGVFSILATSQCDSTVTASATVNVGSVIISPSSVTLVPGIAQLFQASLAPGISTAPLWSVDESTGGSIDQSGLYTPPTTQGSFHVRATMPDGSSDVAEIQVGIIKTLVFTPSIQINVPGDYEARLQISGASGGPYLATADLTADTPGTYALDVVVDAKELASTAGAGPYSVTTMELRAGDDEDVVDQVGNAYTTPPYPLAAMDQPWLQVLNLASVTGLDTNGNGLIDQLVVEANVQCLMAGTYVLVGELGGGTSGNGLCVSRPLGLVLPSGQSKITVTFNVIGIASCKVPLPWNITLEVQASKYPGMVSCQQIIGQVTGFTLSQFE
jgi:hypothetical protein